MSIPQLPYFVYMSMDCATHKLIIAWAGHLYDKYQISCSDPFITHDISITMLLIIHYWFVTAKLGMAHIFNTQLDVLLCIGEK